MTDRDERGPDRRFAASRSDPAARRNGDDDELPVTVDHRELEVELRRVVVGTLGTETASRAAEGRPPLTRMDRRRLAEATVTRALRDHFRATTAHGSTPLTPEQERQITLNVLAGVFSRLPVLDELLEHPDYTDLFHTGPDDARARTLDGREVPLDPFFGSDEEMVAFTQDVARKGGRLGAGEDLFAEGDLGASGIEQEFTPTHPVVDLRLSPSGARFSAVGPWVTANGTHISIRRHPLVDADQDALVERAMYDAGLASFFGASMRAGYSMVIVGAPGAGKTTLARALAHELDPGVRIVQIEQNPELALETDPSRHNQVLAWIERPANMEGRGAHTLADHAREAQRHYPDRLIVGEVRGGEVMGLLQALSLGVPGLFTMHAKSATNTWSRLVFYAQQADQGLAPEYVLRAAAESLDLVVYLRTPTNVGRAVATVLHVGDYDEALKRPICDDWFGSGPEGVAAPNPNAPIPAADLEILTSHGYDPSLHHGRGGGR
jgi:Flp pilus assembly CpaF family ATPase